jgi:hypothetical protein
VVTFLMCFPYGFFLFYIFLFEFFIGSFFVVLVFFFRDNGEGDDD